jgi:hypothetical protein
VALGLHLLLSLSLFVQYSLVFFYWSVDSSSCQMNLESADWASGALCLAPRHLVATVVRISEMGNEAAVAMRWVPLEQEVVHEGVEGTFQSKGRRFGSSVGHMGSEAEELAEP